MQNNPKPQNLTPVKRRMSCLKALADENRLAILGLLKHKEMCVCDIWTALNLPQNLVSHHLGVLKRAGLVEFRKDGLNVHYSTNKKCMQKLQHLLQPVLEIYDQT